MTRVMKVELLVITNELDANDVVREIEQVRYPNDCLSPRVVSIDSREVRWSDDHPLNRPETWCSEYRRMFLEDLP